MRLVQAIAMTNIIGIVIAVAIVGDSGGDLYGYLGTAIGAAVLCTVSGFGGAGVYRLTSQRYSNPATAKRTGGMAAFFLVPLVWAALLISFATLILGNWESGPIVTCYALAVTLLPSAIIGAIFGAGVGQA